MSKNALPSSILGLPAPGPVCSCLGSPMSIIRMGESIIMAKGKFNWQWGPRGNNCVCRSKPQGLTGVPKSNPGGGGQWVQGVCPGKGKSTVGARCAGLSKLGRLLSPGSVTTLSVCLSGKQVTTSIHHHLPCLFQPKAMAM